MIVQGPSTRALEGVVDRPVYYRDLSSQNRVLGSIIVMILYLYL